MYNPSEYNTSESITTISSNELNPFRKFENDFDDVLSDTAQYGRVQFWDMRYAQEHEPFEWYFPYSTIKELVNSIIEKKDANIIVAGCGNSNLIYDMYNDFYNNLLGFDFSRVVITQQRYKFKHLAPHITFEVANAIDTNLPSNYYDALIDKGLFDSLLCTQTSIVTVAQYIYEVERMLTASGVFLLVSHGAPDTRLHLLEQHDIDEPYFTPWVIEVQAIQKPEMYLGEELDTIDPSSMYFIYICRKDPELVRRKTRKIKKLNKDAAIKNTRGVNLKPM